VTRKPKPPPPLPPPEPSGFKIGYARVSTEEQNPQLQIDALLRDGVDPRDIWEDRVSGIAKKRPKFDAMMKDVRPGDTVVVWKLDRLGRNAEHLLQIAREIEAKGAYLRIIGNLGLDSSTASGKMMFHILGAFAEFERNIIAERTKAGLAVAKAAGRVGGRRFQFTDEQILTAYSDHGGNLTKAAQSLRYRWQGKMRSMTLQGFRRALERAMAPKEPPTQPKEKKDAE
jgi:DNA invertase Pin-like site-specific DNA recombinase